MLFSACRTVPASNEVSTEVKETLSVLTPPRPSMPVMESVVFEDKDEGLWLAYEQYRKLERNIIALREYTARLEVIIDFYEKENRKNAH